MPRFWRWLYSTLARYPFANVHAESNRASLVLGYARAKGPEGAMGALSWCSATVDGCTQDLYALLAHDPAVIRPATGAIVFTIARVTEIFEDPQFFAGGESTPSDHANFRC